MVVSEVLSKVSEARYEAIGQSVLVSGVSIGEAVAVWLLSSMSALKRISFCELRRFGADWYFLPGSCARLDIEAIWRSLYVCS